jgi:predicted  nucleic acid-binding Zn-ribbon protein
LKIDINNINVLILTLSSKSDLEKLERDINRNKNSLLDVDYRLRNLETKVADVDSK